jgi:non-ribosomal peptide synthetase component F
MAIEMLGGVYCPLSPRDPQHRLYALTHETKSHIVLVHYLTKIKFNDDITSVNIEWICIKNNSKSVADVDLLAHIIVSPENVAYIIFTSGSTGIPKAVSNHKHQFLRYHEYLIYFRLKFDIEISLDVYIL